MKTETDQAQIARGSDAVKLTDADWRFICAAPIFAETAEQNIRRVISTTAIRHCAKGTTLFRRGDPASAFYITLEGWVKLGRANEDGVETVVEIMGQGECFAEAAMFLGMRYPVDAVAVTDVRLAAIEFSAIRAEIHDDPDVALGMLASLSKRLHRLVDQIDQIKARSAPERVAEFLLGLSGAATGPATFQLPFEKTLAAARLGMRPESFSRAIARLRKLGVHVDQDYVKIDNCADLVSFVRVDPSAPADGPVCDLQPLS